jgi:serine/threonine-protein kinase
MAPEQVKKGRTVDRRVDVWALGVTLHELITGKLPYDGEDDVEVIRRLMADEAPTVAEETPEAIVRVLSRSMVLDADARFPTAAGMRRGLEAAMKELGDHTTSEDVAAFLRSELPDLATKRREVMGKAIDKARERGTPPAGTNEPDAFAPTQMSERLPATVKEPDAGTFALTRRKDSGTQRTLGSASVPEEVQPAPPRTLSEPIRIPKSSRLWLWTLIALVGVVGGAAFAFPAERDRVLSAVGLGHGVAEDVQPAASTSAASASPSAQPPPVVPSAIVTLTASAPSASAAPTAVAPVPPVASARPAGSHHTWPAGAPPSASPSSPRPPGSVPSASAAAPPPPVPSASAPAPPPPPPAPTASDEDPNNPYSQRPPGSAPPL